MSSIPDELRDDSVVAKLLEWAQARPSIRAMLLTSTRAYPNTDVDALSDYDVILVVPEIQPYYQDRSWLADFGDVLVTYWDPIHPSPETGVETFANVVQYESGLRIDFTLWPIEQARKVAEQEYLPAGLDVGYVILLDKDRLTDGFRLESLNLLHFLSKYGRPKIVGSVALGLMTWRDIDIDLEITGEIREEDFWQTAQYLLAQDEITLVTLVDNRDMIEKNRPPSMYIGGKYQADERTIWKLDIRFVSEQHAIAQKYIDHISSELTDDRRRAILSIKHVVAQDPRYRTEISSVDIYDAVLNKGITDLEGFREQLRKSGIEL